VNEDWYLEPVSADTARRARDLMLRFFVPHAVRLYGQTFGSERDALRRVGRFILVHGKIALQDRDLNMNIRELRGPGMALERRAILRALEDCGWLEREPADDKWNVNPKVFERFAAIQAAERQRLKEVRAKMARDFATVRQTYPGQEE